MKVSKFLENSGDNRSVFVSKIISQGCLLRLKMTVYRISKQEKTVTCGVESVYSSGLIAELIGKANTAIHTARSPGGSNVFSTCDLTPIAMIGIQHRKSVRIMKKTLLASALSLLACALCALARISRTVPCAPSRLLDDHDFNKMAT